MTYTHNKHSESLTIPSGAKVTRSFDYSCTSRSRHYDCSTNKV